MSDVQGLDNLSPVLLDELRALEQQFDVTPEKLKQISHRFEEELKDGLVKDGTNISMNVTWVLGSPTGHERGSFLTMDLGGTNLRVCWITLKGQDAETEIIQEKYLLPTELKTGSADALWDFITNSLAEFIKSQHLGGTREEPLPLGFTFSYPAIQEYIDHGKLQTWTKGFDIDGMEGEDVASQLRDAMDKRDLPVKLVALINDTVGAMIASAYNDPETIVGAIFGTGCNAAYMDHVGSIGKLRTDLPPDTPMAINCEYGAFDNARKVLPLTKYDEAIDRDSPRPGEQAFEKMSAGLYLGEIFRLVLCDLHERNLIFKGQDVSKLREPYLLDTGFLSSMEDDPFAATRSNFEETLNIHITWEELQLSHRLAEVIAERGARLCTCGISAICLMKSITSGHVAADGSVANKHPKFKARWAQAMGEVLGWPEDRKEDPIIITSAEDGSGVGAAVIAAMTLQRIEKGDTAGVRQR
ncbi:hypothetical protein LTR97_008120 [Elasticomyces elasticus]|uniref:Phosphotransferase n=1 Tax=Elasticomyces elasticus TaxID=574655 RepID=A0AAN8A1Z7_9PEZI|nr:hypothetical protein LTR97_008120 [Elasticomyces elasticus]